MTGETREQHRWANGVAVRAAVQYGLLVLVAACSTQPPAKPVTTSPPVASTAIAPVSTISASQASSNTPTVFASPEIKKDSKKDSAKGTGKEAGKEAGRKLPVTDPTLQAYQSAVAQAIHRANPTLLASATPSPPYRAVVTQSITISPSGDASIKVLSGVKDADVMRRARVSIRNTEPLPKPPGNSPVTIYETWLFDAQGKFMLKSILNNG